MIEFKALAMKTDIDKLYAIFLLKKNVWADIIKMILRYPPIVASKTLKEWKVTITLVGQGYKFIKKQQDYKTGSGTTYKGWGIPIDIRKSKENFMDRKPRYFIYDIYR